jgi:hypothetical protein
VNEWILVGVVLAGTVVLLGGFGWVSSILRKKDRA